MSNAISTVEQQSRTLAPARFDAESGKIVIATPIEGGFLEFEPLQQVLTAEQVAILGPIGITKEFAPANVVAFLNDCRSRGFDPWAREAYLMKYPGDKYVHHIGIAGFRRKAEETGQLEGRDPVVYYDAEGNTSRVWLRRGEVPYAAEVTVYRRGRRPETRVALYDEYCPLMDEKVNDPAGRKNEWGRPLKVSTGRRVPVPMWRPGPEGGMVTIMLGKCGEALALRAAFPEKFNNWYIPEETAAAAAEEPYGDRGTGDGPIRRRQEAYRAATGRPAQDVDGDEIGVTVDETPAQAPDSGGDGEPKSLADDDGDQDEAELLSSDQVRALLLDELAAQAEIIGCTPGWMCQKWAQVRGVTPADFPTAELPEIAAHVARWRDYVIGVLRKQGRHEVADHYKNTAPLVGDRAALFGPAYTVTASDLQDAA